MYDFEDKIALVFGGGSGIGAATAKSLVSDGATVVVLGRKYKKVEETAERINVDKCIPMKCDVSCEDDVSFAIKSVEARFGKIDLLANMAGISGQSERVENYSFEEFKRVYEINVYGTFLTMKYCLPIMQRQKNGAIVNTCSCSGLRGYQMEIGYGSSKAAVLQMTRNAAAENGGNGVRVNCVSPGWVDTDMLETILAQYASCRDRGYTRSTLRNGTMNRPATAEEVAAVVCFLLSDKAYYVNGANFKCDGGKTLG